MTRARKWRRRSGVGLLLRPALLAALALLWAGTAWGAAFTPGQAPLSVDTQAGGVDRAPDAYTLALAPIRYWGVMSVDLRMRDLPETGRSTGEVVTGILNAATYVWQPWFMQITGSIGLVAGLDQTNDLGNTTNLGGVGSLNVGVFPVSRFPFNFYADVNDSRTSGQATDIDYRSYRLRVSQSYSPELGNERYYGSYEYSLLKTINSGLEGTPGVAGPVADDAVQVVRLGASRSWQQQSLEGDVSVNRNRREEGDVVQQTKLDIANLYHSFRPGSSFGMSTGLTYTRAEVDAPRSLTLGIALPGSRTSSDFTQLLSFATYRPAPGSSLYAEGRDLMATATFRAFGFGNDVDGSGTRSQGTTGQLGINYSLTPRTQLYSTTQLGYFTGDIDASSIASQSLGVTHTSDPVALGTYRFFWTAGGSATAGVISGGPNDGADYLTQANGSYSISRPFDLGAPGALVLTASQGLAYGYGSRANGQGVLTTTLTSFWNSPGSNGTQAFAGATLADARRFGEFTGYFQLVNLQANLQMSLSRWSTVSAGLTFQASRAHDASQDFERPFDPYLDAIQGDWRTSYGAQAMYTHVRAFSVPRLLYTALLQASSFDYESRALGNVDGALFKVDWLFENRLEYQIGRLTLLGTVRWADIQNRGTSFSVFLRAQRTFGGF